MKKNIFMMAFGVAAMLMTSCGGGTTKNVVTPNYGNNQRESIPAMVKQKTREVDRLAAEETNKMRAVGVGNDYEEKEARREALNDAKNTLAGYIETAVLSLTQEYHKKTGMNKKKLSESQLEGVVETAVSQKVSTKPVGVPEIYNMADGSIQVYVCLELTKPNDQILSDVYEDLTKDQVIGVDYDKMKFIQDNKDRIKELREKSK